MFLADASNVSTGCADTNVKDVDSSTPDHSPDAELAPVVTSPPSRTDAVVIVTPVDDVRDASPAEQQVESTQVRNSRLVGSFSPSLSSRDGQTRRIAEYARDSWLEGKPACASDVDTESEDESKTPARSCTEKKLTSPQDPFKIGSAKVHVHVHMHAIFLHVYENLILELFLLSYKILLKYEYSAIFIVPDSVVHASGVSGLKVFNHAKSLRAPISSLARYCCSEMRLD